MNEQKTLDYARIAQAIGYIRENFKRQPGLDEIAGGGGVEYSAFPTYVYGVGGN